MFKVVYLVSKLAALSDDEFIQHWTTTHAGLARAMPGVRGYSINLPSPEQRGPRPKDGYAVLWFDTRSAALDAWASEEGKAAALDGQSFMAHAEPLVVQERTVLPPRPAGYKVVYLVTKLAALSDDEFIQHWTTTHAGLARAMPGVRGYSINLPSPEQRGPRPKDGYAVLWFDTRSAALDAWASEEGKAAALDGQSFMAHAEPLVVQERTVLGTGEGRP